MKNKRLFRRAPVVSVALLVSLILLPLAHASTFIGFIAAQQDGSTCGGNCSGPGGINGLNDNGDGAFIQAPFAGQLVAASFFTGSQLPNNIVILTGTTSKPATTTFSGSGGGTMFYTNAGYSTTVADAESLTGLSPSTYTTVNLANPVTVSSNQWVAVVVTANCAFPSTCNELMFCGASATPTCHSVFDAGNYIETGFQFGGSTGQQPTVGNMFSTTLNGGDGEGSGPWMLGASFNPQGTSGGTVTVTQCYGNCGSPPITLANTNSTHSVNFNQSITLFYEFQSNINGFLLNVTINVAKSYTNSPTGPAFGVYTIPSCPLGQSPFSVQCPGLLQQQSALQNFFSPTKGRVSFSGLKVPVSNGQWVGIALSAVFSGFDVNDTNTNVSLFQTNEGKIPPSIQQPQSLGNSKVGLWAWVVGNVVTGTGPTAPGGQFNCPGFLDCLLPNWVNSLCSNPTTTCTSISGMIWGGLLAIFFTFFTLKGWSEMSFAGNTKLPIVDVFLFWGIIWMLAMGGLSLSFTWIPLFFFFVVALMFGKHGTFL